MGAGLGNRDDRGSSPTIDPDDLRRAVPGAAVGGARQTIVSTALPTLVGELGGLDASVLGGHVLLCSPAPIVTPLYGKIRRSLRPQDRAASGDRGVSWRAPRCAGWRRNMVQLIVFRGLQGIGGGGLIVITMAMIGDLIPPRERGRYQGLFGAGVRARHHHRPAARRIFRRPSHVAMDFLHQPFRPACWRSRRDRRPRCRRGRAAGRIRSIISARRCSRSRSPPSSW